MITWRDILALCVAAAATAALGAAFILPAVYPQRVPLGYVTGTILSYDVTTTKLGGTRGTFEVRLDRGETLHAEARDILVPGDRVCVRAMRRGSRIEGFLVAMGRCSTP